MRFATRGFTLLEILITISIMGILGTIAINANFTTSMKRARDARRIQDLKNIQNALESYYTICGFIYPTAGAGNVVPSSIVCASPATTLMSSTPKDPQTNIDYTMTGGGISYTLQATLEAALAPGGTYDLTNIQ